MTTSPPRSATIAELEQLVETTEQIRGAMESVIEGKPEVVATALTVLLAGGHLLLEDVPGVGKTMLAKAMARAIDCSVNRIQFTSDMLPSDITGVSVYNPDRRDFEFKPGPVFANIVLGDEINRAPAKTQAAMLECMAEQHVSVDGVTYHLETPFIVIATQNPIEMTGTHRLPEAQRDRFMAWLSMGYPSTEAELAMLDHRTETDPLQALTPVTDAAAVRALIATVTTVHASPQLKRYLVDLVSATRRHPQLRLGASPRATLHLLRAAQAHAALAGRPHVVPDDIKQLAGRVLAHRLILTSEARSSGVTTEAIVAGLLDFVAVPAGRS